MIRSVRLASPPSEWQSVAICTLSPLTSNSIPHTSFIHTDLRSPQRLVPPVPDEEVEGGEGGEGKRKRRSEAPQSHCLEGGEGVEGG